MDWIVSDKSPCFSFLMFLVWWIVGLSSCQRRQQCILLCMCEVGRVSSLVDINPIKSTLYHSTTLPRNPRSIPQILSPVLSSPAKHIQAVHISRLGMFPPAKHDSPDIHGPNTRQRLGRRCEEYSLASWRVLIDRIIYKDEWTLQVKGTCQGCQRRNSSGMRTGLKLRVLVWVHMRIQKREKKKKGLIWIAAV